MLLSIIIVNWNTRQDTLNCLASIWAEPPHCPFEVLVIDNASSDGSSEAIALEFPQVRLQVSSENLGFARANNQAALSAQGEFWLLLNPDTIVRPGAIDTLVGHLTSHAQAAAVGPRLLSPDGSIQRSIERLPTLFNESWRLLHLDRVLPISQYPQSTFATRQPHRVEVLSGACLLLRRDAIAEVGLFDEEYFMYSEEIDLCDRLAKRGWELWWIPEAEVLHLGGQSTRQVADQMFVELHRNKIKFFRKRRGRREASLYKALLFQAAFARYAMGRLLLLMFPGRPNGWRMMSHQYGLLLAELHKL